MIDMDIPKLSYFLENPRGRCLESHVRKNFPEFYNLIKDNDGDKFSEKIYLYYNKRHTCPICGNPTRFVSITEGYLKYCSLQCSSKATDRLDKIKATMRDRYGVDNASQSESIKQKKRDTYREHYGADHFQQSEEGKERFKKTCQERYGVDNPSQSESIKQKKIKTCRIHYGTDYFQQSEEGKERFKKTCQERYGVDNPYLLYKDLAHKSFTDKFLRENPLVISVRDNIYTCHCSNPDCNKCQERIFEIDNISYNNRKYSGSTICTKLLPLDNNHNKNTTIELFIQSILDKYNIKYETNNRKILNGLELDIYIPEYKLAVECNGIYWHSLKDSKYHYNKYIGCREQGIQLLTIWEDQIKNKPDIVESILLSKLGVFNTRIYARCCDIRKVDSKSATTFLNDNHLQGSVSSPVRLGLYYHDQLVSLMTFGRKRRCMGGGDWELHRYCSKLGVQVVGGVSRLFSHFVREYQPSTIDSFSSNDISNGSLYRSLGFSTSSKESISYWYIDSHLRRYHRYTFRKDRLVTLGFDKNRTEKNIMKENGYYIIYDSGQSRHTWSIKTSYTY